MRHPDVGAAIGRIALGAALLVLAACGAAAPDADDALPATVPDDDPGLVHVHGLGVNPADGDVYVATHFGLWRLGEPGEAQRVGDYFYDFMGFTVLGADHFVASGHPLLTDDLPPLLGLVESTDGGETWRSVSLLGTADFHALRAGHGLVYGWNSTDGAFMVSADGREWDTRSTEAGMLDFVVDPEDPDRLLGTIAESLDAAYLVSSDDGGRSWLEADGPPLVRLAWTDPGRLWGASQHGTVWRSTDGGSSWSVVGSAGGAPEALADAGDRLLLAAGGAILESIDGGATWHEVHRHH
jgi:photosystem II stability/assembly factor-like uncharacterized protein